MQNSFPARILCALLPVLALAVVAQAQCPINGGDPIKPVPGTEVFTSLEGSATLMGFSEFTNPSTPPKKYRKKEIMGVMYSGDWPSSVGSCDTPQYPNNYSKSDSGVNIPGIPFLIDYSASLEPISTNGNLVTYRCSVTINGSTGNARVQAVSAAGVYTFFDGSEITVDANQYPYNVYVEISYVFWQAIPGSGAMMGPMKINQTRDEWNLAQEWPNAPTNSSQRFQGLQTDFPLTSGGDPVAAPANFFSIDGPAYGSGVTVNPTQTVRETSGSEVCFSTATGFKKYSGLIRETLSEEDTPEAALQRAMASATTGSSNTAYETTVDSNFQIAFAKVHFKAAFKPPCCPGDYEVWAICSVKAHGSSGSGDSDIQKIQVHLDSESQMVEGDIIVRQKDTDYTVESLELHSTCALEPPGHADPKLGSVDLTLSLGHGSSGASAGQLLLKAESITAATYTPAALVPVAAQSGAVEVIRDASGVVRQVKAPQTLADIVTLTSSSYEVRFYSPSDVGAQDSSTKVYGLSGTPFVVFKIENPDSSQITRLRLTETRGSIVRVNEYAYDSATTTWSLSRGNGLRNESLLVTSNGADTTRASTIRDGNNNIVSKTAETRRTFPWGDELVSEVLDPDGAALATTYDFYANSASDGANFGQLRLRTNPDGSWERHTWDASGRPLRTVRPWLDSAPTDADSLSRVTENTYGILPDADGDGIAEQLTTTIESTLGQETGRSYRIDWSKKVTLGSDDCTHRTDIRCVAAGAAWDAPANLVTDRLVYTVDPFVGRERRVLNPDGTSTLASYALDANGQQTAVVSTGAPNAAKDAIVDGTRTTTFTNPQGQITGESTSDIASGLTLSSWTATQFDALGRPTRLDYIDGSYETRDYACCGLSSARDRSGLVTSYLYDDLGRQTDVTVNGMTTRTTYDADGRVKTVTRIGTDNSSMVRQANTYDLAGRLVEQRDALNRLTTTGVIFDSGTGRTTRTITSPAGTNIEMRHRDGSQVSVGGTTVAPRLFDYGLEAGEVYTKTTMLGDNGETTEWAKTYTDFAGRAYKTVLADGATTQSYFNAAGQISRQVDPDGVTTLHAYNGRGEQDTVAIDLNGNGLIDFSGTDRITKTVNTVAKRDSYTVQRSTVNAWETDGQDTSTAVTITEQSADGMHSWQTQRNLTTATVTTVDGSGGRTVTTTAPDGVKTIQLYSGELLSSTTVKTAGDVQLSSVSFGYDAHHRLQASTDARNGTTSYAYYDDDQIRTMTTPDPDSSRSGDGYDSQTTTYTYDSAGRVDSITQPDGGVVHTTYWPTGAIKRTWGARTYPVEYTYDAQGRVKTLTTWQDFAGSSGAAVTTWSYSPQRGWLDSKRYADNSGPNYTYKPSGRLLTRLWARGVTTTYTYNPAGDLSGVDYSDTTSDVTMTYDRAGRPKGTTDASGVRSLSYDISGQLKDEDYSGGLLNGLDVHRTFDSLGRLGSVSALSASSVLNQTAYAYDAASRLDTVTQGASTATYSYLADSSLVGSVAVQQAGVTRLSVSKAYDHLDRLASIASLPSAATVVSATYDYNGANQRTKLTRENNAYWSYTYDALGQVTSGRKFLPTAAAINGFDYAWIFDDIGNRRNAVRNASSSVGRAEEDYTANLLNQYTQRTVPGSIDVSGAATDGSTITVSSNGGIPQAVTRQGDLFYKQLPVDNASSAQNPTLRITGVKNLVGPNGEDAVTELTQAAFVAHSPESFTYDADGNLTDDARWHYTWDGENRLIAMETSASAAAAGVARQKLELAYDAQGRRVSKNVFSWTGGAWLLGTSTHFVYDGWNLLADLNALSGNAVICTYAWGLDLSGSLQGSGGVGGLLFASSTSLASSPQAPCYDGNGNVIAYVDMATGAQSATYDYGAFGETVAAEGIAKDALTFRFSTKYTDNETGLLYYGLRYYSPSTGRWLSRDPIEERGGLDIYAFVHNSGINDTDYLGLWSKVNCSDKGKIEALNRAEQAALQSISNYETILDKWTVDYAESRHPTLFRVRDLSGPFKPLTFHPAFVADLKASLGKIRASMLSKSVVAEACNTDTKECGKSDHPYAYTTHGASTIWFCPKFFDISPDDQASVVLHEYSHLAAFTTDKLQGSDEALSWPNYGRWAYFYNGIPKFGLNAAVDNTLLEIKDQAWRRRYVVDE